MKKIFCVGLFFLLMTSLFCFAGEEDKRNAPSTGSKNAKSEQYPDKCRLAYFSLITGNRTITSATTKVLAGELKQDLIKSGTIRDTDAQPVCE